MVTEFYSRIKKRIAFAQFADFRICDFRAKIRYQHFPGVVAGERNIENRCWTDIRTQVTVSIWCPEKALFAKFLFGFKFTFLNGKPGL